MSCSLFDWLMSGPFFVVAGARAVLWRVAGLLSGCASGPSYGGSQSSPQVRSDRLMAYSGAFCIHCFAKVKQSL